MKPKSGFAAVQMGGSIVLIGGNDGKVLDKVESLDLKTYTWSVLPSLNIPRDELAVTLGPDLKIYAVGGYGGSDK